MLKINLKEEQKAVDEVVNNIAEGTINISVGPIKMLKTLLIELKN